MQLRLESFIKKKGVDRKTGEPTTYDEYVISDQKPTAIIFGSFQPWTGKNGHGRMIEFANENGIEKVAIVTMEKSDSSLRVVPNFRGKDVTLTNGQLREIIKKSTTLVPYFENKDGVKFKSLMSCVRFCQYEFGRPVFMCGEDDSDKFGKNFIKYSDDNIGTENKTEFMTMERNETSATKVRELLGKEDKQGFCEMTGYDEEMYNFIVSLLETNINEELKMGGNVSLMVEGGNASVGKVTAQKMIHVGEVKDHIKEKLVDEDLAEEIKTKVIETLMKVDEAMDGRIWGSEKNLLASISGSSAIFFSKPFEDYIKLKKSTGDIDVQVPKELLPEIKTIIESKSIHDPLEILGHGGKSPVQLNCIFRDRENDINIQIDLEPVTFVNGVASPFDKFAHSSSAIDLDSNIDGNSFKGVFHKWLLTTLGTLIRKVPKDHIHLTEKGHKSKIPLEGHYAFSVDFGLRDKLKMLGGNQFTPIDTKKIKEIESKETKTEEDKKFLSDHGYITDLAKIFKLMFNREMTKKDEVDFNSFKGLINIIKSTSTDDKKKEIADGFFQKCFGKNAQEIEPIFDENLIRETEGINTHDRDIKLNAVKFIKSKLLGSDKLTSDEELAIEKYYIKLGMKKYKLSPSQGQQETLDREIAIQPITETKIGSFSAFYEGLNGR